MKVWELRMGSARKDYLKIGCLQFVHNNRMVPRNDLINNSYSNYNSFFYMLP